LHGALDRVRGKEEQGSGDGHATNQKPGTIR
jgi:hypothetical protein